MKRFDDRAAAGKALARRLAAMLRGRTGIVVMPLADGAVPIAVAVATRFGAPVEFLPIRKLEAPFSDRVELGAVAPGGERVLLYDVIARLGIAPEVVAALTEGQLREIAHREAFYGDGQSPRKLVGACVVLVHDGIDASDASWRAAIKCIEARGAGEIVVAMPAATAALCARLAPLVDQLVCLHSLEGTRAARSEYTDAAPVPAHEARRLLAATSRSLDLNLQH
jgi:putative phosphoribosyl transferase